LTFTGSSSLRRFLYRWVWIHTPRVCSRSESQSSWRGQSYAVLALFDEAVAWLADDETKRLGVPLLRVDCYGGGQGDLVRFYESAGYRRTETIKVKEWPGQILERRFVSS